MSTVDPDPEPVKTPTSPDPSGGTVLPFTRFGTARREDTYLASLLDAVPDCDAVKDYARIVMDNAARRRRAKWATR